MPKKRLLIVLAAGSSVGLSMPRVADIDRQMRSWATEFSNTRGVDDVFDFLWRSIERYGQREPKESLRPPVNYERVLGEMVALAAWMRPAPHGTTLREAVGYDVLPAVAWAMSEGNGPFAEVNLTLTHLLIQLAQHFRRESLRLHLGRGRAFER